MARIIESTESKRRIIQLSSDDIISIVQDYQQFVKGARYIDDVRDILENKIVFIPESNF